MLVRSRQAAKTLPAIGLIDERALWSAPDPRDLFDFRDISLGFGQPFAELSSFDNYAADCTFSDDVRLVPILATVRILQMIVEPVASTFADIKRLVAVHSKERVNIKISRLNHPRNLADFRYCGSTSFVGP